MQLISSRIDVEIANFHMELPQNLSYTQLFELRDLIDQRIKSLDQQPIITEVETHGYYCTTKYNTSIPGLEVLKLPLYVNLSTHGSKDIAGDSRIVGLSDRQQPWIQRLKFNYQSTSDDRWDGSYDIQPGDGCRLTCRSKINVSVYYKTVLCPPEGSRFDSIDDEGRVDHWRVEDGKLYCNDQFFAPVDKWDRHDIFVVPS